MPTKMKNNRIIDTMELFIPGLVLLLLSALFCFLVIPRIGSSILAVICIVALIIVGIHHYTIFSSEYSLSTWQNSLASSAPFVTLGLSFVFMIGAALFVFGGSDSKSSVTNMIATPLENFKEAVVNSLNVMPTANTATNPLTSVINSGINSFAANNASSGNSGNNGNSGNRNKKNKSPVIPGLNFPASEI